MKTIYLDIETIPTGTPDAVDPAAYTVTPAPAPANWKDAAKIAEREAENAVKAEAEKAAAIEAAERKADEAWRKGALGALTCQIVSISWAIDDGEIANLCGTNEEWILRSFAVDLRTEMCTTDWKWHMEMAPDYWCAYNGIQFDLPVLAMRCIMCEVALPCVVPYLDGSKYRITSVVDPMQHLPLSTADRRSLDHVARHMGFTPLESDVTGATMLEAVRAERWDEIAEYNRDDVRLLRGITTKARLIPGM